MYALEKIQQELANSQNHEDSEVLHRLVEALENEDDFPIHELYGLNFSHFKLAMDLLRDWRLARHRQPCATPCHADSLRSLQIG